jgi:hypothetical protein
MYWYGASWHHQRDPDRNVQKLARMNPEPKLERWEKRAEWPLGAVAVIFLACYSVQVLAQPQGDAARAVTVVIGVSWALFAVDYVARLSLASNRWRWFFRHLFDLAIVALPLLRPLRLLRLVILIGALQKAVGNAIRGRVVIYTVCGAVLWSMSRRWRSWSTNATRPTPKSTISAKLPGGPSPPSPPLGTAT